MKGIVFTEFIDMVDDRFGVETTEHMVSAAELPSGGAYTSVGTYDPAELVSMLGQLSGATRIAIPDLVKAFGGHLLVRFAELFPDFFDGHDALSFLENVDGYIHGEVRKLYPDATLPSMTTRRDGDGRFVLVYTSERRMGDLAEGLIEGAIAHFGDTHSCERHDLPDEDGRQCVQFVLTPRG